MTISAPCIRVIGPFRPGAKLIVSPLIEAAIAWRSEQVPPEQPAPAGSPVVFTVNAASAAAGATAASATTTNSAQPIRPLIPMRPL